MVNPQTTEHTPLAVLVTAVASTPRPVPSSDNPSSPTAAPIAAPSSLDRALHATLSRLVICLVNEKLVAAGLVTLTAYQTPAAASNLDAVAAPPGPPSDAITAMRRVLVLGPFNSDGPSFDQGIRLPNEHQVQYAMGIDHSPVCGTACPINGKEPLVTLEKGGAYHASMAPVYFLDPEECEAPMFAYTASRTAVQVTDVRALMHSVAEWNNFDLEVIDGICNEMASSVAHQAY
ncbi:hypothetical protein H4R35_007493, partial [Dimargaris xerosporica]